MKNILTVCCLVVGFTAFAEEAPAGAMDMTKMGPAARKPTDEKKTKKEVTEFFKKMEATKDMEAMAALHDFPLYMATDDLKGVPETKNYSKEEFVAMMKPFMENMPKDAKTTHKPTFTVLSDSLVNVVDDFTMTMGKTKISGRNAGLLVKVGADWKWKSMVEAGWGGMPPPAAAAAPAPAPAPAPAAKAAPAPAAKTPAAAPAPTAAPAKK